MPKSRSDEQDLLSGTILRPHTAVLRYAADGATPMLYLHISPTEIRVVEMPVNSVPGLIEFLARDLARRLAYP